MGAVYWWLFYLYFFANLFAAVSSQKDSTCSEPGELVLESQQENSTCGFVTGNIKICIEGLKRTICDMEWTIKDALVACQQLGYSSLRADVYDINLSIGGVTDFVPECNGTEANITSCHLRNISVSGKCTTNPGVKCFMNDSSVSLCYADATMVTNGLTQSTVPTITSEHEGFTQPSPSTTETTTQATTNFLTTPIGIGVIATLVSIVIFVLLLLILVVILVLVCKRSPASKREHAQVSPSLEGSFKDDGKPTVFTYSGSPGQSRHTTGNVDVPAHHYIEQSPLYEQVKDVAPPSVSSHDSGRSTTASDTNLATNYSTLERNEEMPTYSTLERGQADYAQVQPFISNGGSLTRGATLQSDSEDHYHVLDRSTSQSSNFTSQRTPSTSSSPKPRSKSNVSPKQTRTILPSITDDPDEIPEYAELSTPVEGEVQFMTTVPQKVSPELPARRSPGQYRHHSTSISGRPATHERVSPRILKKASTLPNTGRAGAGLPPSQRWSGTLDTEHSNGLKTLVEGRLTSSNQERIPNSSWV